MDYEKHNHILKCIDFEVKRGLKEVMRNTGSLWEAYLHQRSWELVEEDLNKVDSTIPKNLIMMSYNGF